MLRRGARVIERALGRRSEWHHEAIGGRWEEIGRLQFDFLLAQGLTASDYLLDVGCGSLRAGIHFIQYLDEGHYFGLEKERRLLEAARRIEIPRHGLEPKRPVLLQADDFRLSTVARGGFDFMLAHSLFTHLEPHRIRECLVRIMPHLKAGGGFFATFNESANDQMQLGTTHRWRRDERSATRFPFAVFREIARETGYQVDYLGEWGHPRGQRMLLFRHLNVGSVGS